MAPHGGRPGAERANIAFTKDALQAEVPLSVKQGWTEIFDLVWSTVETDDDGFVFGRYTDINCDGVADKGSIYVVAIDLSSECAVPRSLGGQDAIEEEITAIENAADDAMGWFFVQKLYSIGRKYLEAEAQHERILKSTESIVGLTHPLWATTPHNRVSHLESQGKYEEAERRGAGAVFEMSQETRSWVSYIAAASCDTGVNRKCGQGAQGDAHLEVQPGHPRRRLADVQKLRGASAANISVGGDWRSAADVKVKTAQASSSASEQGTDGTATVKEVDMTSWKEAKQFLPHMADSCTGLSLRAYDTISAVILSAIGALLLAPFSRSVRRCTRTVYTWHRRYVRLLEVLLLSIVHWLGLSQPRGTTPRAFRVECSTPAGQLLGLGAAAALVPGVAATETLGERLEPAVNAFLGWLCHAHWSVHALTIMLACMIIYKSVVFTISEIKAGNAELLTALRESLEYKRAEISRSQGVKVTPARGVR